MSVIAYRPYVTVRAEEKAGGAEIDTLVFTPTPTTSRRLASLRMVFRSRRGGFQLYAMHTEAGAPLVPVTRRAELRFGMRATGGGFSARYHPVLGDATGPALRLTNLEANQAVKPDGLLHDGDTVRVDDGVRIVTQRVAALPKPSGSPPFFVDDELAGARALGALQLFVDPPRPGTAVTARTYRIVFRRRS
jgi:hypothetical protein